MKTDDLLRRTLAERADHVEPASDAYARLAGRVTEARARRRPWWRSPHVLWLAAAGGAAAAVIMIGALVFDDPSTTREVATTPDPTPAPSPGTTPQPTATDDDTAASTPTPGEITEPSAVVPPEGVVWPGAGQPLEGWPATPEAAAQEFVRFLGGWDLPVGSVTNVDPVEQLADVVLQSIGEDGQPFGEAARVRVAGGFDEGGVQRWGVRWLRSDRIQVDDWFFAGPRGGPQQFQPKGRAQAFEGTIDVTLVDPGGTVVAQGFATAGGTELQEILGGPMVLEHPGGPGYAVIADLGGLGVAPTALTVVAVEIPAATENPPELDPAQCSARQLDPPEPDPTLPTAVEVTRQAIAAAAIACDYEALAALTNPSLFTYSFGGGGDPAGFWREGERRGSEVLRFMVETLKLGWSLDDSTGTALYSWPEVFSKAWSEVTEAERDALRPLYDDNDFAQWDAFEGFFGWRHLVDAQGTWMAFVAGD